MGNSTKSLYPPASSPAIITTIKPVEESEDIEALVERIQSGDSDAFDRLVIHYQSLVTGLLFRFVSQRADLEDLVQEAFIKLWKGIPSWKPDRPFEHWLKRVTVNVGLEYCRRQKRSPIAKTSDEELHQLPAERTIDRETYRQSLEEAQKILSGLPPDDRALMTLLYLNEMPLQEVADHFGWSLANAKIKAYRARKKLQKTLLNHGYRIEPI